MVKFWSYLPEKKLKVLKNDSETSIFSYNMKEKFLVNSNIISILLFIISGYFSGIAFLKPSLWLCAWIGMLLLPFAFHSAKSILWKLVGFSLFILVTQFTGHTWYMSSVYMASGGSYESFELVLIWLLFIILAMVIPQQVSFLIGLLCTKIISQKSIEKTNQKIPFFIWFPLTYLLGEYFIFSFSGLSMANWLYSQWQTEYVLRSVGHLGWNITLIICLIIPMALSESIILKEKKYLYVSLAGIVILLIQPPLNNQIPKILSEAGAVYADSETFRPHNIDKKIKLLVWPEQARSGRPRVSEEHIENIKLKPPLKSKDVFHIIGQETRIKEGLQNSVLALSPEGNLLAVRSKKHLFPALETPFHGFMFEGRYKCIPGKRPAYIEFNGIRVISLLCFEQMDRYLVHEVTDNYPVDLIVIMARDSVLGVSQEIYSQFTAMAVLLAVETGLPVIRSSIDGPAAIIAPDGRVLAISKIYQNGVLSLNSNYNKIPSQNMKL